MSNIGVIGPRSSGKTTYLAALAYFPESRSKAKKKSPFEVEAIEGIEDNTKIIRDAENRILQGASFEPTTLEGGVDNLAKYMFRIKAKRSQIDLVARDYPGEIFNDLVEGVDSNSLHKEFMQECLRKDVKGLLVMLPAWEKESDSFYKQMVRSLIVWIDNEERMGDLRLAIAMSKCERGEIWSGRLDPEIDLFNIHLPQTTAILRKKLNPKNLEFFAISAFGVLGRNDPRPNRVDEIGQEGINSVLREPAAWQPYGLVSPLYWLSTGKRIRADV